MFENLRFRLYHVLERGEQGDTLSRRIDGAIMALVILSVLAVMLETVDSIGQQYGGALHAFEVICVTLFTLEYVLRVWTAPVNHIYRQPIRGRIHYALTPFAAIDLLAILPFYLMLVFKIDPQMVLMLRMLRLMRVFKLARYMDSLKLVTNVFKNRREELMIVLIIEAFLLVLFSSLMYMAEHGAQPEKFSSIPQALWFGVITMTTVGYGDVTPITTMGKIAGASLALVGVAMFALPTGIIASGFSQQVEKRKRTFSPTCPHCGKDPFIPPDQDMADRSKWIGQREEDGPSDVFEQIQQADRVEPMPEPRETTET